MFKALKNQFQLLRKYFKLILGATNQFKLECDVEVGAFPEPVIQWYKNAEIISKDTIQDIVITDKNEIEFVGMFSQVIYFQKMYIFQIKLEKLKFFQMVLSKIKKNHVKLCYVVLHESH